MLALPPIKTETKWLFDLLVAADGVGVDRRRNVYAIGWDNRLRSFDGRRVRTIRRVSGAGVLLGGEVYVLERTNPPIVWAEALRTGRRLWSCRGAELWQGTDPATVYAKTARGLKAIRSFKGRLFISSVPSSRSLHEYHFPIKLGMAALGLYAKSGGDRVDFLSNAGRTVGRSDPLGTNVISMAVDGRTLFVTSRGGGVYQIRVQ